MQTSSVFFIVDDDTDDQEFLIEALNEIDSSISFFTAKNGQEGLLKLEIKAIPFPSLIFVDMNMPRVNGNHFLTQLKNDPLFQSIPVIIYSTSSNKKEMDEIMKLGAAGYLVKQSDYLVLKEQLQTILSQFCLVRK